jgi:hypothetical protein
MITKGMLCSHAVLMQCTNASTETDTLDPADI